MGQALTVLQVGQALTVLQVGQALTVLQVGQHYGTGLDSLTVTGRSAHSTWRVTRFLSPEVVW